MSPDDLPQPARETFAAVGTDCEERKLRKRMAKRIAMTEKSLLRELRQGPVIVG